MDPAAKSVPPSAPRGWMDTRRAALDALEDLALHPLSGELHDLIYAMEPEPEPEPLRVVAALLERHRVYPLRGRLVAILGPWIEVPDRSLRDVLEAHAPVPPDMPLVEEVDRRLVRAAEEREALRARVQAVETERDRLGKLANGTALVGAIVAVVALLGWLVGLGAWEIDWITPPAPPQLDGTQGDGETAPAAP